LDIRRIFCGIFEKSQRFFIGFLIKSQRYFRVVFEKSQRFAGAWSLCGAWGAGGCNNLETTWRAWVKQTEKRGVSFDLVAFFLTFVGKKQLIKN
jgi:hypothetical protein